MPHPFTPHETEIDLCTVCGHGQTHRLHDPVVERHWFELARTPRTGFIHGGIGIALAVVTSILWVVDGTALNWFQALQTVVLATWGGYRLAAARAHADHLREVQQRSGAL